MSAAMPSGKQKLVAGFLASSWTETVCSEPEGAGKLGRATVVNSIGGDIEATGTLEYLLAYPCKEGGDVAFVGMERIEGSIGARQGSFVLRHDGVFSPVAGVSGMLEILPGCGAGDFADLRGRGAITAKPGEHGGEYILVIEHGQRRTGESK